MVLCEPNMNYNTKLVDRNVSTEDLIHEVEKHPVIWNSAIEEYGNKAERGKAWHSITSKFIPDFDDKPRAEKFEISKYTAHW